MRTYLFISPGGGGLRAPPPPGVQNLSWRVGGRDARTAHELMMDLAPRLRGRVQLTTDGLRSYLDAVEDALGIDIDYAQLIKIYGENTKEDGRRLALA